MLLIILEKIFFFTGRSYFFLDLKLCATFKDQYLDLHLQKKFLISNLQGPWHPLWIVKKDFGVVLAVASSKVPKTDSLKIQKNWFI